MNKPLNMAIMATVHCLAGCAIGEVVGMVIGSALKLENAAMILLSIVLAFVFGYGLSATALLRSGLSLRRAFALALAADTVSIASMELVDNLFIVAVPGALTAGLSSWLFWISLLSSLVIAFIVTVPVNWILIKRGKGHALVHSAHASQH